MDKSTQPCKTCATYARPPDDRLVTVSGFGRCAKLPVGHYVAPQAVCRLDPPQWVRKHA